MDTLTISGMNVQVVNGAGSANTEMQTPNGAGNLIIGYNANRSPALFGFNRRTGSHNFVLGDFSNYTSYGGIVAGSANQITAPYASVIGGSTNGATRSFATVTGGQSNHASGHHSSVTGGLGNTASGHSSSVTGGANNASVGEYSSVSGGNGHTAAGTDDWVAGGLSQDS